MDSEMLRRLWDAEADEEYTDQDRGTVAVYELTPRRRGFSRLLLPRTWEAVEVWEHPQTGQLEHAII